MGKAKEVECSKEQALMYAGAAAAAAYCATSALCPKKFEEVHWSKLAATPAGCAGAKQFKHLHSFDLAGIAAFHAVQAYEKPTVTSLAVTGSMWCGVAALMGVHTFKDNVTRPEAVIPGMIAQAGLGTMMIARAVQLKRRQNKPLK